MRNYNGTLLTYGNLYSDSIRSKCQAFGCTGEVNDVTIVGLSKNHGRFRDECQVFLFEHHWFLYRSGRRYQSSSYMKRFECHKPHKAWSTWKGPKPEITARDKYLKDQDNTSDLKLPLRFWSSNSKTTFAIKITFFRDGQIRNRWTMDEGGKTKLSKWLNLFWHLGLSTERTFI